MPTYGYIRTSRDQEPGHPGSDPHVQRRQLVEAGVDPARIYADVAASGAKDYNSRDQWHVLDQQLAQGDVLVVAAIDRLGRRYLETMWAIYDLQRRGIRLRSLADNEVQWTKYLDADPDSPEAFMGNVLASMAAYVASQERQNISRRTRAGLQAARAKGVELGRPRRLTGEQLIAIRQDVEEGMPVAAVARKYRRAQVHAPQHPGPDGMRWVRATPSSRTPGPSQNWTWPLDGPDRRRAVGHGPRAQDGGKGPDLGGPRVGRKKTGPLKRILRGRLHADRR